MSEVIEDAVKATEAPKPQTKFRDVVTDKELKARKKPTASTPSADKYVAVKTKSGGTMWDPEGSQFVEGRATLVVPTEWIDRQVKAGKLIKVD